WGPSHEFILKPFDMGRGVTDQLFHGKFFFIAARDNEFQLWISDGTQAGTSKVKDLNTNGNTGSSYYPSYFYTAEGLYFSANTETGTEPWFTNGTPTGTNLVADINPGAQSSNPSFLFVHNNLLFLNASNGDHTDKTDLFTKAGNTTPLPVVLLQFSASEESDAIRLQWITASSENMDYYEVERSTNGVDFAPLVRLMADAGTSTEQSHAYFDKEAVRLNQPVVYYRLRLVEKDGAFLYSAVIRLMLNAAHVTVKLAPNPAGNTVFLLLTNAPQGKTVIEVMDLLGKKIKRLENDVNASTVQFPIDITGLTPGKYLVRIIHVNYIQTLQLIKQ
ncbi:MAG TPA: T9SS type A sorting domain-containing protein, partial [Flavisolibacter sp.]